ncbi:MAG: PTS sugar transporter [Deltaproteobacteria bacterium]|nr:PTS sugar transporter [Deltaproteobacteria bacterium]
MIEVVLVCHEDLAEYFLKVAEFLLKSGENCQTVAIREGERPDQHKLLVEKALKDAGSAGNPILILTDLFGGTACNVSLPYLEKDRVEVLSGVNLAMLIRALTMRVRKPNLSLVELATECARYAIDGIRVGSSMLSLFSDPKAKKGGKKNAPNG